jgi:Transposase DDE domain group 1
MRLMGEGTTFRRSLRVEVRDDSLSPFGGLVLLREFEERTAFLARLIGGLLDPRRASHAVHSLATLLRFAIYRIVLGLPDVIDAERLRHDPVMRSCLAPESQDRIPGLLPGKSTLHRFLTRILTLRPNRRVLWRGLLDSALHPLLSRRKKVKRVYVDMDSTEIELHGEQEGAVNNGHFRSICYHALSLSLAPYGTTLGILLRPGSAHTAAHAVAFVMPLLLMLRERLGEGVEIVLRADSGFASPKLYRKLEQHGFFYIVRMSENARLLRKCARIEKRQRGRPPVWRSVFRHFGFGYAAKTWKRPRRIVARSEFAPGELLPDWMFLCVHLPKPEARKQVVRTYLKRCKSEQVHDIFKNEMHGSLMSHHRMVDNQVRAWITAIAKNLMLAFEAQVRGRQSATRPATVRARILCVAASFVKHARGLVMRLSAVENHAHFLGNIARRVGDSRPAPRLLSG